MKLYNKYSKKAISFGLMLALAVIVFPIGYSLVSYVSAQDVKDAEPFLERPDEQYKECVRETSYMRFHHWELLRGLREDVVRFGKRGDVSLKKCQQCHTSREKFCNKCHDAVSLTPDCFGCHYYP